MKFLKKIAEYTIATIAFLLILNAPVTTRYGVDGVLFVKRMPLYAKAGGFLYRDWMYRDIVRDITRDEKTDVGKAIAILKWVNENVKYGVPDGLRSMDDHPLNIIIRQYGEKDQIEDIFTILCSYAGMEAAREKCYAPDGKRYMILSFVKTKAGRLIIDAAKNKYFLNKKGKIGGVEDYMKGELVLSVEDAAYYGDCLKGLKSIDFSSLRADEQMPFRRLPVEIKKVMSGKYGAKNNSE
jgi:hypothetical protein